MNKVFLSWKLLNFVLLSLFSAMLHNSGSPLVEETQSKINFLLLRNRKKFSFKFTHTKLVEALKNTSSSCKDFVHFPPASNNPRAKR